MEAAALVEHPSSIASTTFTIIPTLDRFRTSQRLEKHAKEMREVIEKVLAAKKLVFSASASFIKDLELLLPAVHFEFPDEAPGEISITLLTRFSKRSDLNSFFVEMCERY